MYSFQKKKYNFSLEKFVGSKKKNTWFSPPKNTVLQKNIPFPPKIYSSPSKYTVYQKIWFPQKIYGFTQKKCTVSKKNIWFYRKYTVAQTKKICGFTKKKYDLKKYGFQKKNTVSQ